MDCLDCKYCKFMVSKCILRCKNGKFSHWKKDNGSEKVIKLTPQEARSGRIRWREIFQQGERCCEMTSIID